MATFVGDRDARTQTMRNTQAGQKSHLDAQMRAKEEATAAEAAARAAEREAVLAAAAQYKAEELARQHVARSRNVMLKQEREGMVRACRMCLPLFRPHTPSTYMPEKLNIERRVFASMQSMACTLRRTRQPAPSTPVGEPLAAKACLPTGLKSNFKMGK